MNRYFSDYFEFYIKFSKISVTSHLFYIYNYNSKVIRKKIIFESTSSFDAYIHSVFRSMYTGHEKVEKVSSKVSLVPRHGPTTNPSLHIYRFVVVWTRLGGRLTRSVSSGHPRLCVTYDPLGKQP